ERQSRQRSRSPRRRSYNDRDEDRNRDRRDRRGGGGGGFKWKDKRRDNNERDEKRLERGYRNRSRSPRRDRSPRRERTSTSKVASVEDKFGPMIIVHVNDRLGTKAAIPCLASDPIKLFKAQVAARIGRKPHEILLKRQGERPFKDQLTLEDYGVGNGVQIDL
ncbi:ubiquitin-like protein, partial [Acephala macrosclerotiorum]